MAAITPIRMPKWGLSMQEGTVVGWNKAEGAHVSEGDELVDIETAKITNVAESPGAGVLRRIVAREGETRPVGALLGIVADAETSDAELDAFAAAFAERFAAEAQAQVAEALALSTVDAAGRSIRVGRAGQAEGTPVVLVHGWSGDLNSWLFNIEALAVRLPVIALDLPGHGGSSKDVRDGSTETLAETVGAALDALGVGQAHLIGHSLGAAVLVRLAARRPDLARTLTLIAPAHVPGGVVSAAFLDGVIEQSRARALKPVLEQLVADPSAVTREMVEDMLKFKRLDGVEAALAATRDRLLSAEEAAAVQADMAKLTDVLVIASRDDRIVGAPDEGRLPPGWRVRWIENAGHLPHLERAGEVNSVLIERVCGTAPDQPGGTAPG